MVAQQRTPGDALTAEDAARSLRHPRTIIPLADWGHWTREHFEHLTKILAYLNKNGQAVGFRDVDMTARLRKSVDNFRAICENERRRSAQTCLATLQRAAVEKPMDVGALYSLAGRIQRWADRTRRFDSSAPIGKGGYASASFAREPGTAFVPPTPLGETRDDDVCPLEDRDPHSRNAFRLVIKTNKPGYVQDQIHQALIMLDLTNPVRQFIPNFNFLYHVNDCLPRGSNVDKFFCPERFGENAGKRVNLISEFTNAGLYAPPGKGLSLYDVARNSPADFSRVAQLMLQALCACSHLSSLVTAAGKRVEFSHNDLHTGNVLVHSPSPDWRACLTYRLDTGRTVRIDATSVAMMIDFGMSFARYRFNGQLMDTPGAPRMYLVGVSPARANPGFDVARLIISILESTPTSATFNRIAFAYLAAAVYPWLLAPDSRRPFHDPVSRRIDPAREDDRRLFSSEVRLSQTFERDLRAIAKSFSATPPGLDFLVGEFVELVLRTFAIDTVTID